MPWILLCQTWWTNLLWLMETPQWIKNRCLEYHYTKLGRHTYFGWWRPPSELRIDALNTTIPNLADKPSLAKGTPVNSSIDALNTVHKTWQTNIIWQMDPLGNSTPKLADKDTLADGPPSELRIDALNTATQNLAGEPTLANGQPQ